MKTKDILLYSAIGGLVLLLAYKFKSGRKGTDKIIKTSTEPATTDVNETKVVTVETLEPLDTGNIEPAKLDAFMTEPLPDKSLTVDNWNGNLAVVTR